MQKKLDKIKLNPFYIIFILFFIASFVTVAISATNAITKDIIFEQAQIAATNARIEVFPQASSFEEMPEESFPNNKESIKSVFFAFDEDEQIIGLIIVSYARGYGGDVSTMSGIALDGTFNGFLVLEDSETPGLGKKIGDEVFTSKFVDKSGWLPFSITQVDSNVNYVDSIAGATISSRAMVESANTSLSFAKLIFEDLENGGND